MQEAHVLSVNMNDYKVTYLVAQTVSLTGNSLAAVEAECKASLLANYGNGNFVLHSIEKVVIEKETKTNQEEVKPEV